MEAKLENTGALFIGVNGFPKLENTGALFIGVNGFPKLENIDALVCVFCRRKWDVAWNIAFAT